jgi:hypothetical protein
MTRSSPRCFAMKAAFKSEVLVQELIGVVGKSTTHPPCQKIGLELLEVGMHRSSASAAFLRVATHGTPSASPGPRADEPSNGRRGDEKF